MKKIILTSVALMFPAFSYASSLPTVVVVNHSISSGADKTMIVKIPVGQTAILVRTAPTAALVQEHDDNGQVTQSATSVIKPLFVEHIATMPGKTAQGKRDVVVTVTYSFNYALGITKTDASGNQVAVLQKQNTYSNTVTTNVPYGHVEIVNLTLPPYSAANDMVMQKLFPSQMFLTISASK